MRFGILLPYIHGEGVGIKVAWNALECRQKEGLTKQVD